MMNHASSARQVVRKGDEGKGGGGRCNGAWTGKGAMNKRRSDLGREKWEVKTRGKWEGKRENRNGKGK